MIDTEERGRHTYYLTWTPLTEERYGIMSEDNEAIIKSSCCASCGIAEIDDIKLKDCDGCDLVRYCSDECQQEYTSVHEEECKKRAAELREELLFKQPESSHLGDCPICMVPLPLDASKFSSTPCCSNFICDGCSSEAFEQRLRRTCTFCREPMLKIKEEGDKLHMKRIEANDPNALRCAGGAQYEKGEYQKAFEYFTKAAKLGNAWSHYNLSRLYHVGLGVEKDEGKEIYHLEEAAIGGHPEARYHLGIHEGGELNWERAVKHFIIGATLGDDDSLKMLMNFFKLQEEEVVSKEQLDAALRAHKAAVDATKSPQRKSAEEYKKGKKGLRGS